MKLIDSVIRDIDMCELALFERVMAHSSRCLGKEEFCRRYEGALDSFRKELNHTEFCYLLAYLEYLDNDFKYDDSVRLDGIVLGHYEMGLLDVDDLSEEDLELCLNNAISCFSKRGFMFAEVCEIF